ncbi:MAG TPA: O-antigen ligase family protein [Steroidobacteraceae bacterium]
MMLALKELIVVWAISAVVFRLATPVAVRFSSPEDLSRRCKIWYLLTGAAFLSPNFWVYVAIAAPALVRAARKDSNPVALYLMLLHVIPPIPVLIPVPGINSLFPLDNYRLLAFCVLIPTMYRLRRCDNPHRIRGLQAMDVMLLGYGLLQTVLFVPPDLPSHIILQDSATNVIRRGVLFYIDVYLLYFVVSRSCSSRRNLCEAQAAFCLSSAVQAALALFEFVRHWLLYVDIAARWTGDAGASFYLLRGEMLRAQVTAGHALALGFLLALAFGFWLNLQSEIPSRARRIGITCLYWLGLLGAYSRSPWFGALLIYFTFQALQPRAVARLMKALVTSAALIGAILVSPLGRRITDVLPFAGGKVDSGSGEYRARLAQRSWDIIQQHPFFGDQLAYQKMEDLRQGQGIIDLVNSYAQVALFYGICGLALFVGVIALGLLKVLYAMSQTLRDDPRSRQLGKSLLASSAGMLFMMATNSFGIGLEKMYYVLAALAAAYAHLQPSADVAPCPLPEVCQSPGNTTTSQ